MEPPAVKTRRISVQANSERHFKEDGGRRRNPKLWRQVNLCTMLPVWPDVVDFDSSDPRWVGAWWFGFIITSIGFLLVAIPISGFPKALPNTEKYKPDQNVHVEKEKESDSIPSRVLFQIKLFIKAFIRLLRNPVYISQLFAGVCGSLIISGVGSFSFKYLAEQYNLSPDLAGIYIGGLILFGAFGMFLGGLLVRIFNLSLVGMLRLCSLSTFLSAILGISFLAGCPEVPLVGLEIPYNGGRYIDDVLFINNPKFADYLSSIYPSELEVKETTETNNSASYLDIMLSYDTDGHMNTSLYDKRDDFNFSITNFPFLSSNIPSSPAYGVFISQLIRYARASTKYTDFVLRARRLSYKLLSQGYVCDRLTSSLRKFYGRYGELVIHYDVPLSRMVDDIL
ncbi:hypothetical protein FSP39_024851 [Pinctada imbricata]|uniref:Uncharacterized protein n=1 Tax=Pinctada imbricata TaxID=66713 RepID=A0AA88Y1K5_PINIB|nr:hypothetical protein FSP39_024851 [Pinctada imbricata]